MRKRSKILLCYSIIHVFFSYKWSPSILCYFLSCFLFVLFCVCCSVCLLMHITVEVFRRMSVRAKIIAYSDSAWSITPVAVEISRGYFCLLAKKIFPKFNAYLCDRTKKKIFFALDLNQCRVQPRYR